MSRPFYETQTDRDNELQAVRFLLKDKKIPYEIYKLPTRYEIDFALFSEGKIAYLVEVKCATYSFYKHPNFIISVAKFVRGMQLAEAMNVPFLVVSRWTDYTGHYRIKSLADLKIKWGGRTDRGDSQDVEPLYCIPVGDFTVKSNSEG